MDYKLTDHAIRIQQRCDTLGMWSAMGKHSPEPPPVFLIMTKLMGKRSSNDNEILCLPKLL